MYIAVVGNLYIFIHYARYTIRDKRPFRLYCRRTSILRGGEQRSIRLCTISAPGMNKLTC